MKKSGWISICCVLLMAGAVLLYSLLPQPRPPYTGPITPAAFSNNEAILDDFGYKDFDSKTMLNAYGELVETKELFIEGEGEPDPFIWSLYTLESGIDFVGVCSSSYDGLPANFGAFYSTNKKAVFYRDIRIGDKLEDVLNKFPHEERQPEPWGSITVQPIYGEATHMGKYAHIALKDGKPEVLFLSESEHCMAFLLDEQQRVSAVSYGAEFSVFLVKRGYGDSSY